MKYRLKSGKVIRKWGEARYSVSSHYEVQRRFLFFWVTVKAFWEPLPAERYLDACLEVNDHKVYE